MTSLYGITWRKLNIVVVKVLPKSLRGYFQPHPVRARQDKLTLCEHDRYKVSHRHRHFSLLISS